MTHQKVLILEKDRYWADIYQKAFMIGSYETHQCQDAVALFQVLDHPPPDMIFWVYDPQKSSEMVSSLKQIHQMYPTVERPIILLAIQRSIKNPEIQTLIDGTVDKVILDVPEFLAYVKKLLQRHHR